MFKNTTIYLADDDADDRLLLTDALKSIAPDLEIVETESGLDLLAILHAQIPPANSLIILDMNMPKMNGLETLANLRDIPTLASIPAVMLSTSGNANMIQFAKQLGAMHYFIKPSTMGGLLELSHKIIFGEAPVAV
ncbi:response regulator [Dyadobacter fanqingshengii]|uniref:Response regulator n=1 Tax=Dyadobacter fanqingshengii TaxID=2906443 RepID=A0A9X1P8T8_9BACT|nr:response regulator [Dyadobacter fanqingshengii]MCF0040861.1 response regulator [Dyadobacter fanqingshengii]MCF2506035.1 response regulator [Dyadobacter fanqingshengii]USJ37406.1 response regulator [Dyadobacter fanqingshengii]